MRLFSSFTDWLYRILLILCCTALAGMVVIISSQVFCRFFLNFTPSWTEELTLIIMIYSGFVGAAVAYKKRLHINLQFFLNSLSTKYRNFAYFFIDICLLIFSLYSIIYGWQLAQRTMGQINPAMGWPVGLSYLAIPISGVFFLIFTVEKILVDSLDQKHSEKED